MSLRAAPNILRILRVYSDQIRNRRERSAARKEANIFRPKPQKMLKYDLQ